jgi:hypothetical protein
MSLSKEIAGIIGLVLVISTAIGSTIFYVNMASYTSRAINGDQNALSDAVNETATEVVETVEWSAGMTIAIAIAGAIGVPAVIIGVLKKYR